MSFAGMVAQLLGEPVALVAWAGPVLVHLVDGPRAASENLVSEDIKAQRPKAQRRPRKAARAPQQVEVIPAPA